MAKDTLTITSLEYDPDLPYMIVTLESATQKVTAKMDMKALTVVQTRPKP